VGHQVWVWSNNERASSSVIFGEMGHRDLEHKTAMMKNCEWKIVDYYVLILHTPYINQLASVLDFIRPQYEVSQMRVVYFLCGGRPSRLETWEFSVGGFFPDKRKSEDIYTRESQFRFLRLSRPLNLSHISPHKLLLRGIEVIYKELSILPYSGQTAKCTIFSITCV